MRPCRHCGGPATSLRGPASCLACSGKTNRATTAARNRRWRAGRTTSWRNLAATLDELLPVACWCEAQVGMLTPEEIRAGQGVSCGPDCRPESAAA